MARFCPGFFNDRGRARNKSVPTVVQAISAVIISTLKQRMRAASTECLDGIATVPGAGKHPVVSGNLISRPDVDRKRRRGGADHAIEIEWKDCRGRSVHNPPATTRRLSQGSGGSVFAFLDRSSRSHRNSAHLSSGGLRFGRGLHAARLSRSVLNVPFQSSIRALMLLHAARRARSSLCGESATRPSSSSRPIGP